MTKVNKDVEPDKYQEYLNKKHASFETPEILISDMVNKATNSKFSTKERIVAGEVNEVYDVSLHNKENVIVRISRSTNPRFEAEEKAIRLAAQVGVPTPKVLLIKGVNSKGENLTFCVEEKIEGEPLAEITDSLDKATIKLLMNQAGNILSKIHSVRIGGFGGLDMQTPYKKWSEYILRPCSNKQRIVEVAGSIGIDTRLIDKAIKSLRESSDLLDETQPQLLHGDYGAKHMLVNNKKIVGIIDFENAKGGDPIFDLAWFNYFSGDSIFFEWIKDGYTNKKIFRKDFDTKMVLYKLHLSLTLLDYYESEKNTAGLEHTKKMFMKDISQHGA